MAQAGMKAGRHENRMQSMARWCMPLDAFARAVNPGTVTGDAPR
jgi:hypothetical protein